MGLDASAKEATDELYKSIEKGFPYLVDIDVPVGALNTRYDPIYEFHDRHCIKWQRWQRCRDWSHVVHAQHKSTSDRRPSRRRLRGLSASLVITI